MPWLQFKGRLLSGAGCCTNHSHLVIDYQWRASRRHELLAASAASPSRRSRATVSRAGARGSRHQEIARPARAGCPAALSECAMPLPTLQQASDRPPIPGRCRLTNPGQAVRFKTKLYIIRSAPRPEDPPCPRIRVPQATSPPPASGRSQRTACRFRPRASGRRPSRQGDDRSASYPGGTLSSRPTGRPERAAQLATIRSFKHGPWRVPQREWAICALQGQPAGAIRQARQPQQGQAPWPDAQRAARRYVDAPETR